MTAPRGALALVLHSHMPYVEGYGTWPFGEEWLWEAIATSYLPLLDVLDAAPGRVTLSLTPVLCDQLEAAGAGDRFVAFMRDVRPESHRLDIDGLRKVGEFDCANQLERSAQAYAAAAETFQRRGDLLAALAPHTSWTSSATHAVLPLLATEAGIRLQVRTGVAAHRARFGTWAGGFWLPECAHAPWLDPLLEEAGVHATCVDLTDVFGLGAEEHLRPLRTAAGPLLVPIDRALIELVWSPRGYPSGPAYLDTHRLTTHHHRAWANDGSPYDPERARAAAVSDAQDFVARAGARVRDGGLSVCALDTELLGHWWPEGVDWLGAVIAGCETGAVRLAPLDELLRDTRTALAPGTLPITTWGEPRDLSTWSSPAAGGLAWRQRAAELAVLTAADRVSDVALRELLALQASDWAFLITRGTAGDYPAERVAGHEARLHAALAGEGDGPRNLAVHVDGASLYEP